MDDIKNPSMRDFDEGNLEIPEALKRKPVDVEKIPDVPVELERQFVTVEEEGGKPVEEVLSIPDFFAIRDKEEGTETPKE